MRIVKMFCVSKGRKGKEKAMRKDTKGVETKKNEVIKGKGKKRVIKIIGIVFAAVLLLGAGIYGYYKLCMDPYRGTVSEYEEPMGLDEILTAEEAQEDLEYLMKRLRERHPIWLDGSVEKVAAVEAEYENALATMGNEVSGLELYRMASRIAATLHDGHTGVDWCGGEQERYIDDFTVIWEYGKPLTIDGISCREIIESYKKVCSYEVDYYAEALFWGRVITYEPYLRLCGVDTSDGVEMTFENEGEIYAHSFRFVPIEQVNGYESSQGEEKWVYYEIDRENSVGIFTLTSCVCNEEYLDTLEHFFDEIFAADIRNVVVDLRGNGGGNSWVANEFFKYLDVEEYRSWNSAVRFGWYLLKNEDISYQNRKKPQVFSGDLYVVTDTWTYSAAMDFAMMVADNDLGMIVGKPSGNLPDSYGDLLRFQLPNSKLPMYVSYKKWCRIDQTKAGQPIMPDVEAASAEALEKVYELLGEND